MKQVNNNTALAKWLEWLHRDRSPSTATHYHGIVMRWADCTGQLQCHPTTATNDAIWKWCNPDDSTIKVATRHLWLAALRSYFAWCRAEGYTQHNPAQMIRIRTRGLTHEQKEPLVRRPFTKEEFEKVIAHVVWRTARDEASLLNRITEEHHASRIARDAVRLENSRFWIAAVTLGWHAGLRLCDVCGLEQASDLGERLVVHTAKTGARITVPINEAMRAVLPAKVEGQRFFWPNKARRDTAALSAAFGDILKRCQIEGVSYHSLRHAYASECAKAGIPTPHIQRSLGHANEAMTKRYIHTIEP